MSIVPHLSTTTPKRKCWNINTNKLVDDTTTTTTIDKTTIQIKDILLKFFNNLVISIIVIFTFVSNYYDLFTTIN